MAGLISLAGAITGGSFIKNDEAFAFIIPLDEKFRPETGNVRSFQFWPAEITDTSAVNYSAKTIPGANLPFYQWISGGEHKVAFSTMFAADIKYDQGVTSDPEDKHTVNVAAATQYLRSLKEPTYVQGKEYALPPPALYLCIPNVPIGPGLNDRMLCVMTQCDITYKKEFPDGTPRLAEVSLEFAEILQNENTQFYGRSEYSAALSAYNFSRGSSS